MAEITFRFRDSPFQHEVLSGAEFYTLLGIVKSCSNAKYLPANKEWAIDITTQNLKKLVKYLPREKFNEYAKFIINKNQIVGMDFLKPFQVQGVKELLDGKKLLADDVGLGKTLQLLAYTQQRNYKRVLVVTPAPLKRQWQEEIAKFFEEKSTVLDGTKSQRERKFREYVDYQERYLIVNYEQLKKTNAYLFEHYWDCVLFDEVHRLKNSKTFAHKAAKKLDCSIKLGATATPFVNVPMELFTIVNFLQKKFFNWVAFTRKYCVYDTVWNGTEEISVIVGYKNLSELNNDLKSLMIRRKKHEVLKELPVRSYKNCFIPMKAYQKRLHDAFFAASKDAYHEETNNVLAYLTLARLASNSTNQVVLSESPLAPIIQKIESGKLEFLSEELAQFDEKILIFTQWEKAAQEIAGHIGRDMCIVVSGKTKDKFQAVKDFKNSDKKYLIATDCLNYGMNLEFIRVLIHFDLPWSPAKIEQREGRIDRLTQKNKMLIIKLISEDSVEDRVVQLLENKQHMFNTVIDGTDFASSKSLLAELFK